MPVFRGMKTKGGNPGSEKDCQRIAAHFFLNFVINHFAPIANVIYRHCNIILLRLQSALRNNFVYGLRLQT